MKNARKVYQEYIKSMNEGETREMGLIYLEKDNWTDHFAVLYCEEWLNEGKIKNVCYMLYWIAPSTEQPEPIRTFSDIKNAETAFHAVRYESSKYEYYPF